jgi:hypothetical protein
MTITTIKITELDDIGADLGGDSVLPVVNMTGTPVTEKTVLSNIANVILQGAGIDYSPVAVAAIAGTVTTAAQPNITSVGTLTSLTVSGNVTANNFIGGGSGTPTLSSNTNLDLSAGTSVRVIGGGTFRLPNLTTSQIANVIASNGDMVYNSTTNKLQAYVNGAWGNVTVV